MTMPLRATPVSIPAVVFSPPGLELGQPVLIEYGGNVYHPHEVGEVSGGPEEHSRAESQGVCLSSDSLLFEDLFGILGVFFEQVCRNSKL